MNFQGIECIEDNLKIIDHSGDIYDYRDENLYFEASLIRKDAKTIKEKNSLVHTNSLVALNDNQMIASNAMDKLPATIALIDYSKLKTDKYLAEKNFRNLNNDLNIKGAYIEQLNIENYSYLFLILRDNKNEYHYQIFDQNLENLFCSIDLNENNIQNIYWDNSEKTLSIIKNPIKNRFGQINKYEVSRLDECLELKVMSREIILNPIELQGFEQCHNKNYRIFTKNSNSLLFFEN
tara:strand:+ start:167 stop:874 length:708 start_codon:yes stop_codon:yes gene_type:complete